ncbi:MAG: ornithine carbamoyltransferase, partial [Chloroflexi bacterium]
MAVAARARHFVSIADLDRGGLAHLLERSSALKAARPRREPLLAGRTLAQIFEKPSLRTRLSFD